VFTAKRFSKAPLTVQFTDQSLNDSDTYVSNFRNSTNSTEEVRSVASIIPYRQDAKQLPVWFLSHQYEDIFLWKGVTLWGSRLLRAMAGRSLLLVMAFADYGIHLSNRFHDFSGQFPCTLDCIKEVAEFVHKSESYRLFAPHDPGILNAAPLDSPLR